MTMAQFSRDDILLYSRTGRRTGRRTEEGRRGRKKKGRYWRVKRSNPHLIENWESRLKQPDNTLWEEFGDKMQRYR